MTLGDMFATSPLRVRSCRRANLRRALVVCACVFSILLVSFSSRTTGFAADETTAESKPEPQEEVETVSAPAENKYGKLGINEFSARTPFILAACIFFLQNFSGILSLIVLVARGDPEGKLQYVRDSMAAYVVISAAELVTYGMLAIRSDIEDSIWTVTFVDGGPYLICRNWCWLLSTPVQWYCFCKSCKSATTSMRNSLIFHTIMMQAFGILAMYANSLTWAWIYIMIACAFFIFMFLAAYRIPIDSKTDGLSGAILTLDLFLWGAYPVCLALRMQGYMSVWLEQVLAYTILDVFAKTVSFSGVIVAHLMVVLQGIDEASRKLARKQPAIP